MKQKVFKIPTEFGLESNVNMQDVSKVDARAAVKMNIGRKYTIQTMLDNNFNITSAYSYVPKKGFKFIWSDRTDLKKFLFDPKAGNAYNYGFTVEFGFDAF